MPTKRGTKSKKSGTSKPKTKAKTEVKNEVKDEIIEEVSWDSASPVDDKREEIAPKAEKNTKSEESEPQVNETGPTSFSYTTPGVGDEVKLLLLENHQLEMKNFYMRSSRNRVAPKKPKSPIKLAEELGNESYAQVIQEWNAKMIQRFRPKRGYVLPDVETPQQILEKLK